MSSLTNPLPTGTVSFLFTDIESSASLTQRFPSEAPALLAHHDAILRQSIEAQQGHVFQIRGDAFCAAFFTAGDALCAALQAQRQLQQEDWNPTTLKVRMGIHTGTAQACGTDQEAGGYTGYLTLTRAQRVMALAYGEQILVSNPSAELLQGELPEGVQLRDLGEHRLKGLLNPEHIWQAVAPDLVTDFPPLPSLNAIPNNLPVQLTSFIGREREIEEVVHLLHETRLLTLTGVGGAGKTRLALQAAAETLQAFPDGVWLVELAPLADPALLLQTVAAVLGVRDVPGRPVTDALLDYLRAKKLLLLLDNCEHLMGACAQLADRLLHDCPALHILASSREALGIAGERMMQVPSLALPDLQGSPSVEDLLRSEAVQLFLERAQAVQTSFVMTAQRAKQDVPVIAQICRRLDGIPLAIELAAARVKMFSVEQILTRLDDRFRLLTGGSRTALPRQQTLRALIDWSYDLLAEGERVLLRRLSVFAGGWTFEAAEAMVGQDGDLSFDVLDLLAHLIDKSLVLVEEPSNGGAARYRFLETIRQYAGEKLLESGEAASLRDRHLDYFCRFAVEVRPKLLSPEQLRWLDRLEVEHDNLRAALAWGLENDPETALRLAGAVSNFWNMRGYISEGRGWLTRAITKVEDLTKLDSQASLGRIADQARALTGLGIMMMSQGDNVQAIKVFQESAGFARQAGDQHSLVYALNLLGTVGSFLPGDPTAFLTILKESAVLSREIGDNQSLARSLALLSSYASSVRDSQAASAYLEESIRLSREIGDPWNTGMAMLAFGMGAVEHGDYAEARTQFEEGLELFRKIGDKHRVNMAQSELAHLERRQGHYEQALALYRDTLLAWQDLGHRAAVAHQLECIAFIDTAQGNVRRAARLFGAAEALREKAGTFMKPDERDEYDRMMVAAHTSLDESTFAQAWAKGRAMTMEEAIAYALEPANTG